VSIRVPACRAGSNGGDDPVFRSILEEVVTDHGGPCDSVTPGPDSVFRSLLEEKKITTA